MFSKVLVELTGVFIILYISAISATPTAQPGEADKINDNIHTRAYKRHKCADPYTWLRRECVGELGPMAWQDVCVHRNNVPTRNTPIYIEYDNKLGSCTHDTYCLDTVKTDGPRFINCVSNTKKSLGIKRNSDPQIGTSDTKRARPSLGNTQFEYSVTLDHDMTGAAVAAVIISKDDSSLIVPNNIIVGNLHGKQQVVCKGDKSSPTKARECYPNAAYNFKKGDVIDYTWGMTNDQEGTLLYGIMPG